MKSEILSIIISVLISVLRINCYLFVVVVVLVALPLLLL